MRHSLETLHPEPYEPLLAAWRIRPRTLALVTLPIAAGLLLAGCASEPAGGGASAGGAATEPDAPVADDPETGAGGANEEAAAAGQGAATLRVSDREFTFDLSLCTVYDETEVELAGLGGETGSDVPSFLEGGLMAMGADALGEFRADIGADAQFQSTDEFIAIGAPTGGDFTVMPDGDGYLATGNTWDENGNDLGVGTLHFNCA